MMIDEAISANLSRVPRGYHPLTGLKIPLFFYAAYGSARELPALLQAHILQILGKVRTLIPHR